MRDISKRNLRKSINVVLQNPFINENETIRQNLQSNKSEEELTEVLQRCRLDDIKLDDKASVLSGGQI